MRRLALGAAIAALALLAPATSAGAFGLSEFDVSFTGPAGETVTQAGSHPFAMNISLHFESTPFGEGEVVDEAAKDIILSQVAGFVGNPTAAPRCSTAAFLTAVEVKGHPEEPKVPDCPNAAAVGTVSATVANKGGVTPLFGALYNLEPPPGVAAKLGFWGSGVPITFELGVEDSPPYKIIGGATNVSQVLEVVGSDITLWGTPADPRHDPLRGFCFSPEEGISLGECEADVPEVPFLTLPRACTGPLKTTYKIDSWQTPGVFKEGFTETHDEAGNPSGLSGCGKLGFNPEVRAEPTAAAAESAAGLEIGIDVNDEGLANPEGIAQADIEAMKITLPVGLTANPSAAEGLGVCSAAQLQAASLSNAGCPPASKLGTIEADTPVLENHTLKGAVYLAAQGAGNPFGSLLAAYLVIRDPQLGVFITLASEIATDPKTGQIVITTKDLPPFPLQRVRVKLHSGPRAPLITPPSCGPYSTEIELTPSSGAAPIHTSSSFQLTSGPGGAPCPASGAPPFDPGFEAGTANNAASSYSPFAMFLTRKDGEADLTRFSAILPPGVIPKLAGVGKCSDAEIAAAAARSGRQEQAAPSCPAASQVGHILAGAGVGSALTYVPGSLYLAGPYNGDPLSVVAIVPAIAGPFDLGTIVTRVALNLNPITYRGEVDGAASDPIPHILQGIPLKVRDIRVYADRPQFTLNSTSCKRSGTEAQIFGSGADVFDPADDVGVPASSRYQAASCASLGFKPKLALKLKGGTRRDKNPALHTTLTYPYPAGPGYANIGRAVVILPPSEFIDPEHINNPCTRVQYSADACPKGSILGTAVAHSPLLDEPLKGRVIFRSNGGERKLPDVVVDLHGLIDITLVGFVDTATPKSRPRIRTTFASVPDAPVSSFTLDLYGGKRGLLVNNRNLCKHKLKATVKLRGQNGATHDTSPVVRAASCKAKKSSKRAGAGKRRG